MVRRSRDIPQREHNETRMERAWSWHEQSKKSKSDDEKFIFLWIAFNAAYGTELSDTNAGDKMTEKARFTDFVNKIVERDSERKIKNTLWNTFSSSVRILLENKFVFGPFWEWIQERSGGEDWESKFEKSKKRVFKALGKENNVPAVLEEVLKRLYVLRNQIIHGGTTFDVGCGRDQVRDGSRIMEALMPEVLKVMHDDINENPDSKVWGKLNYPRVRDPEGPKEDTP